jgi:hypothetical protein
MREQARNRSFLSERAGQSVPETFTVSQAIPLSDVKSRVSTTGEVKRPAPQGTGGHDR